MWVKSDPVKPGWYWWSMPGKKPGLVAVFESNGHLYTNWDGGVPIDDELFRRGFWWGPFEIPAPPSPE